ncbi:flavoprotein [Streptomyces silvisoli]|uniref:Flavoprotein n=1 Tax=Streptomyces silvisoli TaxID=3034235 RepID=A0ABT5ZX38_9ACTN|nr:flavoprotein [Streptomyces silvisoli]MDF3294392.1 flavoprotein [Streptomyces silvisoli]
MTSRVLYLFGTAAPPVVDIGRAVEQAQTEGWDVCVGLSPTAARWLNSSVSRLAAFTGHPVRSEYKLPGEPDVWPPADVIAVAPATFNTINQWALGITDHFTVGVAAEAIGKGIPLVAMPCVNQALVEHPQFEKSMETLRSVGVNLVYGDGGFVPEQPGEERPETYPWHLVLDAVRAASPR